MEPMELVGGILTGISIAEKLSKYFLPPKTIRPRIKMEYIGGGTLQYNAELELPNVRSSLFRRKKTLDPVLESLLGFITFDLILEGNPLSKSLTLNKLLDWPTLMQDEELNLEPGRTLELRISISIDLDKYIKHNRPTLDTQTQLQLKEGKINKVMIPIENTLSVSVRQYPITVPILSRKLIRVRIRKGLEEHEHEEEIEVSLSFSTRVFSVRGDLNSEFPDIDTSQMDSWIKHKAAHGEQKIIIPVDLEKKEKFLVVLYFD